MHITPTDLAGVLLIEPAVHGDARGWFLESYREDRFAAAGVEAHFVQDNHSCSAIGTLRGLHYQLRSPQAKLCRVVRGAAYDVAVDIRRGSPTFGRWVGATLSEENRVQILIPRGFAHGFLALSDRAELVYKCDDYYRPDDDRGIAWDDPTIGIDWPLGSLAPILSPRDRAHPTLEACRPDDLPIYRSASASGGPEHG